MRSENAEGTISGSVYTSSKYKCFIAAPPGWLWIIAGFALFRLFDIVKPWPIRQADQHIGGGFGIMFDDLLAAIYAWLALHTLSYGAAWLDII